MKKTAAALLLAAMFYCPAAAQELSPAAGARFGLELDYARFRNNEQSGYLEVYYGFYPRLLTYRFAEGKYHGGVKLQTRVKDNFTRNLVAERRTTLRIDEADTAATWYSYPMVTQSGFTLPHGEYTLEVVAADSLAPMRSDSVSLMFQVNGYPAAAAVSDIELCKNITPSTRKEDLFYKNALEVVPHPQILFGSASVPVIFNYVEFYNLSPEETYSVKTMVSATDGKEVKTATKKRKYGVKNAVEVGTTNVTTLPSAKYRFHVALLNQTEQIVADTYRDIFVYNPHLKTAPAPASLAANDMGELARMPMAALDAEFRQAQYLATKDEIKIFSKLTNESGKREFLVNYWNEVAKGRNDWLPVNRAEYMKRLTVAKSQYAAMSKEGWKTNRGRVYLLYGKPDEIERNVSTGETKPHEIWHYYGLENSVLFVFIERLGFGDYELVHSTKRGELQDENWQRFLR